MCRCNPAIKGPYCGGLGCKAPVCIWVDNPDKLLVLDSRASGYCILCDARGTFNNSAGIIVEHKTSCPLHPSSTSLRPPTLIAGEWDALYSYHHTHEATAAARRDYTTAQWHKERCERIHPFTTAELTKACPPEASRADH